MVDFQPYSRFLLATLRRDADGTGSTELHALLAELASYPGVGLDPGPPPDSRVALSLRLRDGAGELAFISTLATFGTPFDVTVSELVLESLFPADERTANRWRALRT